MSADAGHRRTADWNARTYDRLADPQEEWARATIPRLELSGGETVLDAGCGSGRVTRLLLERLPRGRVLGVDGSPSMIEMARESLAGAGERAMLITSDLLALGPELLAEAGVERADAVFSNATFHWIEDHEELFARLHSVMAPGGRLVAQCGGEGNVAESVDAIERASMRPEFAEHVGGFTPWNFRGEAETARALEDAGFSEVRCWLEEKRAEPPDARAYMGTVALAAHKERLPGELHERFTDAVMGELSSPLVLRYVRLNMDARA